MRWGSDFYIEPVIPVHETMLLQDFIQFRLVSFHGDNLPRRGDHPGNIILEPVQMHDMGQVAAQEQQIALFEVHRDCILLLDGNVLEDIGDFDDGLVIIVPLGIHAQPVFEIVQEFTAAAAMLDHGAFEDDAVGFKLIDGPRQGLERS